VAKLTFSFFQKKMKKASSEGDLSTPTTLHNDDSELARAFRKVKKNPSVDEDNGADGSTGDDDVTYGIQFFFFLFIFKFCCLLLAVTEFKVFKTFCY
jgi:hypothetical protein